jgi:lipopolysaccharide export system protein LptC
MIEHPMIDTETVATHHRARLIRWAAVLFPVLLLALMVVVSVDYGATWDEPVQQQRGEMITDYYIGRVDSLAFPEDGAHLYGAPFDVVAVSLQRTSR